MSVAKILSDIDAEIARLEQARALITASDGHASARATRRGRPQTRKKRVLSPEARARIAAAQKRRWAKQRKAAA